MDAIEQDFNKFKLQMIKKIDKWLVVEFEKFWLLIPW